jgi:UDP-2,3-diacylglucosamine pyrophosphatase LpxH
MVLLLLWGFFVFLGVLWVFGALASAYYEYTSHLGVIRRRSKRDPRIDIKKLLDHRFYKPEKDTTEADVLVFGHTHMPEIQEVDVGTRTKLFVNSGSWIQYPGDRYDTFVYIDKDGVLLLQWDGKRVHELPRTKGVVAAKWPLNRRNSSSSVRMF